GQKALTIPEALAVKEELERIDELLKQLEEAAKTAQIAVIDMELLSEFAEPGDIKQLDVLRQQIEDYMREVAERQGLERGDRGEYRITPKAFRLFQGKLLEKIFSSLEAARSGRHQGPVVGEGAVELERTKAYVCGASVPHMCIPGWLTNALLRTGPGLPVRLKPEDIQIHRT